ncbi:hypothetical protein Tco_0474179 [Tanacetum coccineum]
MSVDDLLQLVPKLLTKVDSLDTELKQTKLTMGKALVKLVKKVKKMEDVLKRRHVVLPDSEDEDADISSKSGRNLQEEGLDEMVRSMMKDKSKVFKTPTQSKTLREEDISSTTLEAAKTLSKVASQRTNTGFEEVNTGGLGRGGSGECSLEWKVEYLRVLGERASECRWCCEVGGWGSNGGVLEEERYFISLEGGVLTSAGASEFVEHTHYSGDARDIVIGDSKVEGGERCEREF